MSKITLGPNRIWCDVCAADCPADMVGWHKHIHGVRHWTNLANRKRQNDTSNVNSGRSNTDKVEAEIKIAVHDTSADMVTFKESIGGKSAVNDLAVTSELERVILDANQLAAVSSKEEVTLAYFCPKCNSNGGFLKKKELALFNASSIDKHSGGALFGHLFPSLDEDALGDH